MLNRLGLVWNCNIWTPNQLNATLLHCGNLTQTVSKWATQPLVGGLKTSKIQGKWPLFQKLSIWQVICRIYSLDVEKVEVLVAKKKRKQLFCKQCCREDTHSRVQCPVLLKAFLFVITLGLAWFFWPRRCVCCGTVRIGAASLVRSTPWQWILGLSAEVICQQRAGRYDIGAPPFVRCTGLFGASFFTASTLVPLRRCRRLGRHLIGS